MHMVFDTACFETRAAELIADFRQAFVHGVTAIKVLQEWPSLFRRKYHVKIDLAERLRHRRSPRRITKPERAAQSFQDCGVSSYIDPGLPTKVGNPGLCCTTLSA